MDSPVSLIDSIDNLLAIMPSVLQARRVAVDLETNSMFAYRARVCSVQLGWRGGDGAERIAVVDTLSVPARQLAGLLENQDVCKIIHDVSFDARMLAAEGVSLRNVLDTQAAAGLLNIEGIGLGALLERYFDVRLSKKMQLSDWSIRPITDEMLSYLTEDVAHLLQLAEVLREKIGAAELSDELEQEIAYRLAAAEADARADELTPGEKVKRASGLSGRQREILDRIADVRERAAQRLDKPPQVLINDRVLVAIAQRPPKTMGELHRVGRAVRKLRSSEQRAMLDAVAQGLSVDRPRERRRAPRRERGSCDEAGRDVAGLKKELNRFRAKEAERRHVSPQAILPSHCLRGLLARDVSDLSQLRKLAGMGAARTERYGQQILQIVRRHRDTQDEK